MEKIQKLTKIPINNRLKPKPSRKLKQINNDSDSDDNLTTLKEPSEKITLIERAIGGFNAENDVEGQNNALNLSTNEGPPFICKICKNWFYLGAKLKLHYITNHNFQHCEVCSLIFEKLDEKNSHLTKFHSSIFCEICQEFFENLTSLFDHYEVAHDSCTCQFCGVLLQKKLSKCHMSKHHITEKFSKNRILEKTDNPGEFFCGLCHKNREIDVFFGHMNSYHKLNVNSLLNIVVNLKNFVDISGAKKTDIQGSSPYKNSCQTCQIKFSKKIPQKFHQIYCQSKIICKFCPKLFNNTIQISRHVLKTHVKFACILNCQNMTYNSDENLKKHYQQFHELMPCRYCPQIIPLKKFDSHLTGCHKYTATIMKNFLDTLFEVTQSASKHFVVCCLCDSDITLLSHKVKDIFTHFNSVHSVNFEQILRLMPPRPILEDYDDFFREINDEIQTDDASEHVITDKKPPLPPQSPHVPLQPIKTELDLEVDHEVKKLRTRSYTLLQNHRPQIDLEIGEKLEFDLDLEPENSSTNMSKHSFAPRNPQIPLKTLKTRNDLQVALDLEPGKSSTNMSKHSFGPRNPQIPLKTQKTRNDLEVDLDVSNASEPVITNYELPLHSLDLEIGKKLKIDLEPEKSSSDASKPVNPKNMLPTVAPRSFDLENSTKEIDLENNAEQEFDLDAKKSRSRLSEPPINSRSLKTQVDLEIGSKLEDDLDLELENSGSNLSKPALDHKKPKIDLEVSNVSEPIKFDLETDVKIEHDLEVEASRSMSDASEPTVDDIPSDLDNNEAQILLNDDSDLEFDNNLDTDDRSEYVCMFCLENFQKISLLLTHISEKHKIRTVFPKFPCNYCPEVAVSAKMQAEHLLSHNGSAEFDITKELFACSCKNYQVVRTVARKHILEIHAEEIDEYNLQLTRIGLHCKHCFGKFWTRCELNQHEVADHYNFFPNDFLKCTDCLQTFSANKSLINHFNVAHPASPPFGLLIFKCKICLTAYPNLTILRTHFSQTHPASKIFRCPIANCYKICKKKKYMLCHLSRPHQHEINDAFCDVCGKKFKSFKAATIHKLMKHERERAGFQCRICTERFATSEQRKLHYTTAHPGQLAYNCLECGKGFISKSGLYGHRKIHQENNKMVCSYCNKEFSRRDSYNEHLLIHIGPRHQCPHCPKSFTQRSNLTRHVRIHTGAKPYQCSFCEKRFSDRGACRSHERVHTKEEHCECEYCGKKFTKKQKLKYHLRYHTGEGLLTCEICGKQFSNTYSLNEHKRIHNNETLLMCGCGRSFTTEKYLNRHIQTVHKKNMTKYICPICFKTLFQKQSYNAHIMTHSAVKHVKCLLCNKEYNTKKTVKRHLMEEHNLRGNPEIFKHIYQLTPQEAGLDLPPASEMAIRLINEQNLINIDVAKMQQTFSQTLNAEIKEELVSEMSTDGSDDDLPLIMRQNVN